MKLVQAVFAAMALLGASQAVKADPALLQNIFSGSEDCMLSTGETAQMGKCDAGRAKWNLTSGRTLNSIRIAEGDLCLALDDGRAKLSPCDSNDDRQEWRKAARVGVSFSLQNVASGESRCLSVVSAGNLKMTRCAMTAQQSWTITDQ